MAATADLTLDQQNSLYDDMILSAIEALKSPKGSNFHTISKYISDNYSDLPQTHSTILSNRLRTLQSKNVIRMFKQCYKLEDGSRKRGRPPKSISSSKSNFDESKKRKRGRPAKDFANGPVYIVSQAEQLSSSVLKGFPGAVAIVLPRSLLTEKAARSLILIMPEGIRSLIDASAREKKRRGRPRKEDLSKGVCGDVNGKDLNVVKKGPGRPWKIRDLLVSGNGDEILKQSGGNLVGATGLEKMKRSVGRPRKNPIF